MNSKEKFRENIIDLCFSIWVDIAVGEKLISTIRREAREKLDVLLDIIPKEEKKTFKESSYFVIDYVIARKSRLINNECLSQY